MQVPVVSQQPSAQVAAVHVVGGVLQTRSLSQISPLPHSLQAMPAFPQPLSVSPAMQLPVASQQPRGQVLGSQACVVHCPLRQTSPLLHSLQLPPPLPQLAVLLPLKQTLLLQHPLAQVLGPQSSAQVPLIQLCVPAHWAQLPPPAPQVVGELPPTQVLP